ncbi:hypothetical protein F383_24461 [Gossypium arboreum]|uniref:Uncharacterized protein n=1 Tax=Gossypium arboreum TaxID=29729 RepID=A0A0B0P304_GOSAR|nr:hypothetical protein F383_24461 [Gossypium arboreum]
MAKYQNKPMTITSQYIWSNHHDTYNKMTTSLYIPYSQNV